MRPTRTSVRPDANTADFLRTLVDLTGDLVAVIAGDGRLTFVNRAVCDRLHYAEADLVGQPAIDLVRGDARDEAHAFYCRQMARELADTWCELPLVARHGGTLWVGVRARLTTGEDGRPAIVVAARDISDRKQVETALRESEERYRQAFDENLAGVYVVSPAGQVRSCNPAFVRIHGFPSMIDALGANLGALYPDGSFARLIERVRQEGAVHQHETMIRRVDGGTLHIVESLVGRFDAAHELESVNGYLFDDTPRKDLQAAVRQAQKMDALGRLAGGVAHDFNNILMVINGLSETALEILEGDHAVRQDLEEILEAGRRGATLTAQLLSFGRKRVHQLDAFDLDEAIASMRPMLQRLLGAGVRLEIDAGPHPKWLLADRAHLEQVLLNLAVNGRDAMPQGGRLGIETSIAPRALDAHAEPSAGLDVVLHITDTGEGMTPDVQARAFEPYFTTKPRGKGTGLGLSTVYAIVSESSGTIRIDSEPGRGTRFTIALPLAGAPDVAVDAGAELSEEPASPVTATAARTVLVVEDERPVRQIVTNALKRAGYRVLAASEPTAGLMLLREHGPAIDLLLTDVIMPGLNGRELARDARQMLPDLRVLFMSGYADLAFGPDGLAAAGGAFLQKPFTLEALLDAVKAQLI
jgi:two-component system, cell cycle sensor histidine kinase and response regulator CckA